MEKTAGVKSFFLDVFRIVIFGIIASMVFVLIFAIIIKFTDISDNAVSIVNQTLKVVSVLLGCFFGIKECQKGVLKGALGGLFFTILSFLLYSAINKSLTFSIINLYDILIGIGAGAAAGVLAVNLKSVGQKYKTAY